MLQRQTVAALRAVLFCGELGFLWVILEGDALQVVQVLRKEGKNYSRYGHIIEEALEALNWLQAWNVNHVRRQLNGAAHGLAKEALSLSMENDLIEEVPIFIFDIISAERCA